MLCSFIAGLAECLRSEFQLYSIDIHTYFPGTILSPGYEQENRTKPQITKDLEGDDSEGLSPEECAKALIKGVCLTNSDEVTDISFRH